MIICIPVTSDGLTDPRWGRAARVAVASVAADGAIAEWREFDVAWDVLHDERTEGAHHARVARFLQDHRVEVVVADHMGPGMSRMLAAMGIHVVLGAGGNARTAVQACAAAVTAQGD